VLPDGADGGFRVRVGLGSDDRAAPGLGPARERGRLGLTRRISPEVETSVGGRRRLFGGEVPIGEGKNVTPAVVVVIVA
jgi:hypothetical protein